MTTKFRTRSRCGLRPCAFGLVRRVMRAPLLPKSSTSQSEIASLRMTRWGVVGRPPQKSTSERWICDTRLEPAGWWYLNSRGSYSAVYHLSFPIQGDVAPKVWVGRKNFLHQTPEGAHCLHTLGRQSIPFRRKFLECLKPFFKKVLRRCGQSPRPSSRPSPRPF